MKKNQLILLVFTLLLSTTVMAQGQPKSKAEGNFRLTGQLKELTDSVVIMPMYYGDNSRNPMQKFALKDGKIDITLNIDQLQNLVILRPGDYSRSVGVPALGGEYAQINGSFDDYTITGSAFYQQYAPIEQKTKQYSKMLMSPETSVDDKKALYEQVKTDMTAYLFSHPNDEVSVTLLQYVKPEDMVTAINYLSPSIRKGRMKPVVDAMMKQAANDLQAKQAKERIKEGVMAPDFTLNDIKGKPLTLSSMRGKWVILDFWGSWCVWCIKGMPDMKKYYEKYRGKFEIIGVDCNDTVEKWKKAVKDHALPWLHVFNKAADGTPEKYAVEGYPTKIIIDPQGKINKIIVGESEDFYKYLDELFG